MTELQLADVLLSADNLCRASGARLTAKRKRALTLLLEAKAPISAYELVDQYKTVYAESLTAMSAYRMLNFLVEENLAHKLQSVNKYTACGHIACSHAHELPQFLICDQCEAVSEVGIDKSALKKLKSSLSETGFKLNDQQLELHGLCRSCQSSA